MLDTIKEKVVSDRLWALLAFVGLVFANQLLGLGVTDEQITEVLYATLAFILGKSLRGTVGGKVLEGALVPGLSAVKKIKPVVDAPEVVDRLVSTAVDTAGSYEPGGPK